MTDFNTHPQPRTFAPSKEDVLQNLEYFFGAPVAPEKVCRPSLCSLLPSARVLTRLPVRVPAQGLLRASRNDVPLSRRVRRPERGALRSNRAPATTLLTPFPCRAQTKIRDTLNNLILKSPQNWQTTIGLPFFQIEGTVVEWDE